MAFTFNFLEDLNSDGTHNIAELIDSSLDFQFNFTGLVAGDRIRIDGTDYVLDATDISCLLYTSPSPRDGLLSRMPSSA